MRRTDDQLRSRLGLIFVPLLLVLAVLLYRAEAVAAPRAPDVVRCVRMFLAQPPTWTWSGAWSASDQLVLADPVSHALFQYLVPSGRTVEALPKSLAADLGSTVPSRIQATGNGELVVELANDRLVTFSKSFRLMSRADVVTRYNAKAANPGARIESLWGWTLAGGDLLGYGDVSFDGRQRWESGVFRLSLSNPQNLEVAFSTPLALENPESEKPDTSRAFYRLGLPFLAALKDEKDDTRYVGYVLLMKDRLGIYRHEKGRPTLDFVTALPRGLEVSPQLPDLKRKEDFPSVMRAVEQSTMPAGLWGWNGHLFLLSRAPAGTKTRWTLTKIDPRQGAVLGSIVLPTEANHLTVVPGPSWWAFVEKGPVLGFGNQNIDSAVLVPSQALRGNLRAQFVIE